MVPKFGKKIQKGVNPGSDYLFYVKIIAGASFLVPGSFST
jgi:hypothetical protein